MRKQSRRLLSFNNTIKMASNDLRKGPSLPQLADVEMISSRVIRILGGNPGKVRPFSSSNNCPKHSLCHSYNST